MKDAKLNYWFLLGNNPELSAAEIAAVLNLQPNDYIVDSPFLLTGNAISDPKSLMNRLGGTVKIAGMIGRGNSEESIAITLTEILHVKTDGKIVFGLSAYDSKDPRELTDFIKKIGITVKTNLKREELSARFVFNNEAVLSSVTVQKNNLLNKGAEFIPVRQASDWIILKTVAIQPFTEWGKRDFGRPERDSASGMLPPKLARMMINLLGLSATARHTILDPFCGSGTILTEALSLGFSSIIGSDSSARAVADSEKNLQWLERIQKIPEYTKKIFSADAAKLSNYLPADSIDGIATEPYLGAPLRGHESKEMLTRQIKELEQLYSRAITEIAKVLKSNAPLVIIIPRFKCQNVWLTLNNEKIFSGSGLVIDPIYKTTTKNFNFIIYARPDQYVGREIWRLRKK